MATGPLCLSNLGRQSSEVTGQQNGACCPGLPRVMGSEKQKKHVLTTLIKSVLDLKIVFGKTKN